jgi:hypothetical protein
MTWVIGMPGFLTRGVLVGDVRVTLVNPETHRPVREFEGVRKIYPVAPNIAIGFAGNIDAGFRMVGDLEWNLRNAVPAGHALEQPSRFLFAWRRRARWGWRERIDAAEKAGGCSLLVIGALPPNGPFVPTVGYILRAPEFEAERIPPRHAASIGSGAHVAEYAAELERLGAEWFELAQFDIAGFEGMGGPLTPMAASLSETIEEHLEPGISPHLHLCSVRFGEIQFGTNDVVGLSRGAPNRTMPPVADSYAEWQAFKVQHGFGDLLALGWNVSDRRYSTARQYSSSHVGASLI